MLPLRECVSVCLTCKRNGQEVWCKHDRGMERVRKYRVWQCVSSLAHPLHLAWTEKTCIKSLHWHVLHSRWNILTLWPSYTPWQNTHAPYKWDELRKIWHNADQNGVFHVPHIAHMCHRGAVYSPWSGLTAHTCSTSRQPSAHSTHSYTPRVCVSRHTWKPKASRPTVFLIAL